MDKGGKAVQTKYSAGRISIRRYFTSCIIERTRERNQVKYHIPSDLVIVGGSILLGILWIFLLEEENGRKLNRQDFFFFTWFLFVKRKKNYIKNSQKYNCLKQSYRFNLISLCTQIQLQLRF